MTPYYQDSAVTIYHGDCREIVPTLGRFDLLLTDPPYGIEDLMQPGGNWWGKDRNSSRSRKEIMVWDSCVEGNRVTRFLDVADLCVVWGGNYHALPPSRGWLVWYKPDAPKTMAQCELAWTSANRNTVLISHSIAATNAERVGHPTQKPLTVMLWSIQQIAPDAQTILDPFAGSGTTGRAAKDLGRKAVLIEREEKYCEIAARRMGQEVLAL